jgi:3-methylcrotonyl-CoA carboxylase beta subunit
MQAQVDAAHGWRRRSCAAAGSATRERHVERGKLLPRERIGALLDPGSPFLEIGQLAAHEVYGDDRFPLPASIAGVGRGAAASA